MSQSDVAARSVRFCADIRAAHMERFKMTAASQSVRQCVSGQDYYSCKENTFELLMIELKASIYG